MLPTPGDPWLAINKNLKYCSKKKIWKLLTNQAFGLSPKRDKVAENVENLNINRPTCFECRQ